MNENKTSKTIASVASEILKSKEYSAKSRSVAGSALSQVVEKKETSEVVATKSSKILNNNDFSKKSKSIAGSTLSQTKEKK